MKHKFSGTPSLGWLNARFKKLFDKRAKFGLPSDSIYANLLKSLGFDLEQLIEVEGIFCAIFKVPRNRSLIGFGQSDCIVQLVFRDVMFCQGEKQVWLIGRNRKDNKRRMWRFLLSDIKEFYDRVYTDQESFSPEQDLLT